MTTMNWIKINSFDKLQCKHWTRKKGNYLALCISLLVYTSANGHFFSSLWLHYDWRLSFARAFCFFFSFFWHQLALQWSTTCTSKQVKVCCSRAPPSIGNGDMRKRNANHFIELCKAHYSKKKKFRLKSSLERETLLALLLLLPRSFTKRMLTCVCFHLYNYFIFLLLNWRR